MSPKITFISLNPNDKKYRVNISSYSIHHPSIEIISFQALIQQSEVKTSKFMQMDFQQSFIGKEKIINTTGYTELEVSPGERDIYINILYKYPQSNFTWLRSSSLITLDLLGFLRGYLEFLTLFSYDCDHKRTQDFGSGGGEAQRYAKLKIKRREKIGKFDGKMSTLSWYKHVHVQGAFRKSCPFI